jgi:alkanesulfonate monooxygenase SsuD/methylene tetrahydromethanopterin reductase-like flavin-dependent oxidoreductase (luciferase family)
MIARTEVVLVSERLLKVGLVLPTFEGEFGGATASWNDLLSLARHAEQIGFDSIWVPDHLIYEWPPGEAAHGVWEAWSLLGALAASTTRVEIGPMVSCTAFRNPALLAKMAEGVDEISGGRLVLGLGAGYHEREFGAFGYPYDHLVGRFEEALQIIAGLVRGGRLDFRERWHTAQECELRPRGPRAAALPIMVAAHGPRTLALTARFADVWNGVVHTPEQLQPLLVGLDAACEAEGRDPASVRRTVTFTVDVAGADSAAFWIRDWRRQFPPARGSIDDLTDLLGRFAAAGVDHVIVFLQPSTPQGFEVFAGVLDRLGLPAPHRPPPLLDAQRTTRTAATET